MGVRQDAPMWDEFPVLTTMEFRELAEQYIEVKETIDMLELQKKDIAEKIEAAMIVADQKRVRYGDRHCFEQSKGTNPSRIDSKLLAGLGVSAEVIKAATIPGKSYTYIQAIDLTKQPKRGPGAGAEGEGGGE